MHRVIAYVGSSLGFETARKFKFEVIFDLSQFCNEFEWESDICQDIVSVLFQKKHANAMVHDQNVVKPWYFSLLFCCCSANLVFVYQTPSASEVFGVIIEECMMHRKQFIFICINLNENLMFRAVTSECNSSEMWKGAIVFYYELNLADIMSFVMRCDSKQSKPAVSLVVFEWELFLGVFLEISLSALSPAVCSRWLWTGPNRIGRFFAFALVPDVPV